MSKFKVGDRVRRLPEFRNCGGWDRGDAAMVVDGFGHGGWLQLRGYTVGGSDEYTEVSPRRFELVQGQQLARDELYMRLRNDAKLTHQQATEFLAACPGYASIRHALDCLASTGEVMGHLVLWTGKNENVYRAAARHCGWGY